MKAEKTPEELKALEQFNTITEAASVLMDAGEMDIYSAVREELQRAADAFKDDDDMFADADEEINKVELSNVDLFNTFLLQCTPLACQLMGSLAGDSMVHYIGSGGWHQLCQPGECSLFCSAHTRMCNSCICAGRVHISGWCWRARRPGVTCCNRSSASFHQSRWTSAGVQRAALLIVSILHLSLGKAVYFPV